MKKTLLALLLFAVSCSWNSTNLREVAQEIDYSRFEQANQDMPVHSKYYGQKIENTIKRTPLLLNDAEKRSLGLDISGMYLANIYHKKNFYIAKFKGVSVNSSNSVLRANAVSDKSYYVKERWGARVREKIAELEAHTSLLIEFKKNNGLELVINQNDYDNIIPSDKRELIQNVVVSYEAFRGEESKDAPFIPDAFLGNFAVGLRIYSHHENLYRRGQGINSYVDTRYEVKSEGVKSVNSSKTQDIGTALLLRAIKLTDSLERRNTYHGINNNCTNGLFDLFDTVLVYKKNDLNDELKKKLSVTLKQQSPLIIDYIAGLTKKENASDLKDYGIVIPKESLGVISDLVKDLNEEIQQFFNGTNTTPYFEEVLNAKNSEKNIGKNYLYSLSIFVQDHLSARGILKSSSKTYEYKRKVGSDKIATILKKEKLD